MEVDKIRESFSFFNQEKKYFYLDSAATSLTLDTVTDTVSQYNKFESVNIHRGVYALAENVTSKYELVRNKVKNFISAPSSEEIIFTSGTTESINMIASGLGKNFLSQGDEILLNVAEHHSNIVPWQILAEEKGVVLKFIPLDERQRLDMKAARKLVTNRTKVIAFSHVSNVLGLINPVEQLISLSKELGAISVIDGAQSIPHMKVDVKSLDCDYYVFSGHKILGPTGIGVLYGKKENLLKLPPYKGGGNMIASVKTSGFTSAPLPGKFEAGTSNISSVLGLGSAVDFLEKIDFDELMSREHSLARKTHQELRKRKNITLLNPDVDSDDATGIISFHHQKCHPHDIAAICDSFDICVRAGHHCAQPLMEYFKISASARLSFYLYNDENDIDQFLLAVDKIEEIFC
tara:strand:+ start:461 stop:1675 length:1215 start_codon:yes stop_codon:yes gene_type:complete